MTLVELEDKLRAALAGRADLRFAILFGSSVSRGPDAARDVDVALAPRVSMSLMELGALAVDLERAIGHDVDVIDLDGASTLLRWEVLRGGRVVHVSDEDALRAFRVYVPLEYADLRPYLELEAEGLRRALGAG